MIRTALVLAACARIARADATLDESGPCDGVRARVAALVGRDPFVARAATAIAVTTATSPSGARASLSVAIAERPAGHRVLEAASCAALVDDLALAIAVVLAAPPAPEPRAPDGPPPIAVADAHASEPEGTSDVQLAALGGAATSSHGNAAADLGVRVKHGAWSLAGALAMASAEDLAVAPGTVHISRGEIALLPCLHLGRALACGDLAGGWISGSSSGFTASTTAAMPFAAAGLRVGWEQPLADWLAVQAYAEGRLALTTNRFFIDDMAVWSGSRLEAWLGIAAVAHIP